MVVYRPGGNALVLPSLPALPSCHGHLGVIEVTDKVLSQILLIRDVGVQRIAFERGFYELVCYIEDNKARYFSFILRGEESE